MARHRILARQPEKVLTGLESYQNRPMTARRGAQQRYKGSVGRCQSAADRRTAYSFVLCLSLLLNCSYRRSDVPAMHVLCRLVTLYSLVGSRRRHHIDPFAYLKDVLERLPSHPAVRLGELLPDVWIARILMLDARTAILPTFCAFFPQTAFTRVGHAFVDLRFRAAREVCDRSKADCAASTEQPSEEVRTMARVLRLVQIESDGVERLHAELLD
jgi:IS66 C-terminal element